jgi:hypothetical protein
MPPPTKVEVGRVLAGPIVREWLGTSCFDIITILISI